MLLSLKNAGEYWRCARQVDGGLGAAKRMALPLSLALTNELLWRLGAKAPAPTRPILMVIGHQRSGTTFLHRLLAADPEACALPLHGLLHPNAATQSVLGRLPRPAWLERLQDRTLAPLDPLHRLRLHEPEEDEFLLWCLFRSPMNRFDRPWPKEVFPAITQDETAWAYYAQAIARTCRRLGRRYVGKNPHLTPHAGALARHLPSIAYVHLVRHPAEAIASRLNLIRAIWRLRFPGATMEPHHVARIYENSRRCYQSGLEVSALHLRYEELVEAPLAVLERIYEHAGLERPDPTWTRPLLEEARTHRGSPSHPLEEFGLTCEQLAAELAPVYARFGFSVLPRSSERRSSRHG